MALWSPTSWQSKRLQQIPNYLSSSNLQSVIHRLNKVSALVTVQKIEKLRSLLVKAIEGECFLLQMGDCAECFNDLDSATIKAKVSALLECANMLSEKIGLPIIKIGRIAGQYAKPRSHDFENHEGESIPVYRGDMVNSNIPSLAERLPDPNLMLKGYESALLTIKNIKKALKNSSPNEYIYTSHEALLLYYEQCLTRQEISSGQWYNLSTHYPWLGTRTSYTDSAHVEYLRGIKNPIAVKVGINIQKEDLLFILDQLDPNHIPGRITLIHRFGLAHITKYLPQMVEAVKKTGRRVLWICDPMHGNTEVTHQGIKTRRIENIHAEIRIAFELHEKLKSHLGGLHLEATPQNVIECLRMGEHFEADYHHYYKSLVDPRLNKNQMIEVIKLLCERHTQMKVE